MLKAKGNQFKFVIQELFTLFFSLPQFFRSWIWCPIMCSFLKLRRSVSHHGFMSCNQFVFVVWPVALDLGGLLSKSFLVKNHLSFWKLTRVKPVGIMCVPFINISVDQDWRQNSASVYCRILLRNCLTNYLPETSEKSVTHFGG